MTESLFDLTVSVKGLIRTIKTIDGWLKAHNAQIAELKARIKQLETK